MSSRPTLIKDQRPGRRRDPRNVRGTFQASTGHRAIIAETAARVEVDSVRGSWGSGARRASSDQTSRLRRTSADCDRHLCSLWDELRARLGCHRDQIAVGNLNPNGISATLPTAQPCARSVPRRPLRTEATGSGRRSPAATGLSSGFSSPHGAPPAPGQADGESLTDGHGLLPALWVELGSAKRASRRKWCDSLAALGAVARVHEYEDGAGRSAAAKRNVREPEEAVAVRPDGLAPRRTRLWDPLGRSERK